MKSERDMLTAAVNHALRTRHSEYMRFPIGTAKDPAWIELWMPLPLQPLEWDDLIRRLDHLGQAITVGA